MEQLNQNYGYILYRSTIDHPFDGQLFIKVLHSYAQIYVNGERVGTMDRRLNQQSLRIKATRGARLDILVENTGRVNFGRQFAHEQAGIVGPIVLGKKEQPNWLIYRLPMDRPESLAYSSKTCGGACFYQGVFTVGSPADVFVDTRPLKKGMVWINGTPLGRFWDAGPQSTLYLPASWLNKGSNTLTVFDLDGKSGRSVSMLDEPILDGSGQPSH